MFTLVSSSHHRVIMGHKQGDDVDQIKVQIVLPSRRTCVDDGINGIPPLSIMLLLPNKMILNKIEIPFLSKDYCEK